MPATSAPSAYWIETARRARTAKARAAALRRARTQARAEGDGALAVRLSAELSAALQPVTGGAS